MQPTTPQLPRDDSRGPTVKRLKKGGLWLLLALAAIAALIALCLPKEPVEAQRAGNATTQPTPAQQRQSNESFKNPTR